MARIHGIRTNDGDLGGAKFATKKGWFASWPIGRLKIIGLATLATPGLWPVAHTNGVRGARHGQLN